MFITFEGPEGSGKSTQAQALTDRLRQAGYKVVLTREPGGTLLGDRLREVLLSIYGPPILPRAEALLFCAARAQLVEEVVLPSLRSNCVVVSDRFADSTLAYQGYGRGIPVEELLPVVKFSTLGLTPDLTILLDLPVEEGLRRHLALLEWTRFEREDLAFHERVRSGYLELAKSEPGRWLVLDARRPKHELEEAIWQAVAQRLRAHRNI